MEEKYINREVFEARLDVLEEKINTLANSIDHINTQLEIITKILKACGDRLNVIRSVFGVSKKIRARLFGRLV